MLKPETIAEVARLAAGVPLFATELVGELVRAKLAGAADAALPLTLEALVLSRLNNLPLDRIIQEIQRHQRIFSPRLHPLLCALTSAREVEYAEQREQAGSDEASGKFASMLLDIFGQTYPENAPWTVDRAKVVAYKAQVAANVAGLRRYIADALG